MRPTSIAVALGAIGAAASGVAAFFLIIGVFDLAGSLLGLAVFLVASIGVWRHDAAAFDHRSVGYRE